MARRLLLIGSLLACLGVTACGEKQNPITPAPASTQSVSLMLDWTPNADHVGLYRALAQGDFAQAALSVHVITPSDPSAPLQQLAAGKVDFAISYEPQLLLARNANQPLVSVAAIVQRPLTSIISLRSAHITQVARLRGKLVGDAGLAYQHAFLTTILAHAGVPASSVGEVNVGEQFVSALLSKRIDAAFGAYWNVEALALAQMGKHVNVLGVQSAGIPTYDELVLVVRASMLAAEPDVVRRFVQALARGYESARQDPAQAVDDLLPHAPGLTRKLALQQVQATLPAFFPSASSQPWGYQDPNQWNQFGAWMLAHHLLTNVEAPVDASTNEVLAGQGV